jgi:hypothetical protein
MTDKEKAKHYTALRPVTLESVAAYLRCEPQRLATALRRLAETPSAVKYGVGESACITPAVMMYKLAPAAEVEILEDLLMKPDTRGLPGAAGAK